MSSEANHSEKNKAVPVSPVWLGGIAAAFVLAYFSVWSSLVNTWSNSEDYSHGFIIVPFCLYILWRSRERFLRAQVSPSWWGLLIASMGLVAYLFAELSGIVTLASLSMIPVLAGTVLFLFGWHYLRISAFPLFLLLFAIPVPAQIYSSLTLPLQLIVTKATAFLSSTVGIPIWREGNILHLPNQTFEVVQACSGMRSVMTMLTLGAIFGYFTLNSGKLRVLLFASGIPVAIFANMVRVFLMVAASYYLGLDLAQGAIHDYYGIFIFLFAFALFLLTRKVLARWDA